MRSCIFYFITIWCFFLLLNPILGVISIPSSSIRLLDFSDFYLIFWIWAINSLSSSFSFLIFFDFLLSFISFLFSFLYSSFFSSPSLTSSFYSFYFFASFNSYFYFAFSSFLIFFFSNRFGGTAFFILSYRPLNSDPLILSIANLISGLEVNWIYAMPFPINVYGSRITRTFKIPSFLAFPMLELALSPPTSFNIPEKWLLNSSSLVLNARLPIKTVVSKSFYYDSPDSLLSISTRRCFPPSTSFWFIYSFAL